MALTNCHTVVCHWLCQCDFDQSVTHNVEPTIRSCRFRLSAAALAHDDFHLPRASEAQLPARLAITARRIFPAGLSYAPAQTAPRKFAQAQFRARTKQSCSNYRHTPNVHLNTVLACLPARRAYLLEEETLREELRMDYHDREPTGRWIWLLVAALAAWGLYLAVGAFRFNHDVWRGVVVFGCMAAFLGFWLVMMKLRGNRDKYASEFEPQRHPDTEKNDVEHSDTEELIRKP